VFQLARALRAELSARGTTRLGAAAQVAAGSTSALPGLRISPGADGPATLSLDWPHLAGATHLVLRKASLQDASWAPVAEISSASLEVPSPSATAFYRLQPGASRAPRFHADPVSLAQASVDLPFNATLAGFASDADPGDSLTFVLQGGPAWLACSGAGLLTGTPAASDVGHSYFDVLVTDPLGNTARARAQLTVVAGLPPASTSTFTVTADTYARLSNPTATSGTQTRLEVRRATSSFARLAYLRFDVAGVGTVVSAQLKVRASNIDGTRIPEADALRAHMVADSSWGENTLNWENRPAQGALAGSAGAPDATGWYSIPITPSLVQNGSLSFALDEQGDSLGNLDARENGAATAPILVVEWR
jgi:hypothetical protein